MIALFVTLYGGLTWVFRRKFSASKYWNDCVENKCTVAQYIGELCHYLLESPPSLDDKAHKIRLMIGNGLRPSMWEKFQSRFNIAQIGEFYSATESNSGLFNMIGKTGAVGFMPPILLKFKNYLTLVKYNVEKDEIVRGPDGFCIKSDVNEPGQLISEIKDELSSKFIGYTDKAATEKKILRDVFIKGDAYLLSGDLLKRDSEGFFYFVDRIGDTFRWKGENVATREVETLLKDFPGIKEVNVYGVAVPNTSGRAGMAHLIVDENQFDLKQFYEYTNSILPSYALPLFLRFSKEIEVTGTLKHLKVKRTQEGFDPNVVKDPLYFRDMKVTKSYVPLTQDVFHSIMTENAKL